jgi:Mu-like prophage I protein
MSAIDLGAVQLAENRPTWLHAFPLGEYHHPPARAPGLHPRAAGAAGRRRQRGVRGITPALDFDHREDRAKGGKAAGWIEAAEVRTDGLWIAVRLTAEALAEVRAGAWRYLSPEFGPWTDPRTRVRHGEVLLGAVLTNRPFLRDLAAVAACEPVATVADDPQAAFVKLAEQAGAAFDLDPSAAYRLAAREHPDAWAAYREAADLNGQVAP